MPTMPNQPRHCEEARKADASIQPFRRILSGLRRCARHDSAKIAALILALGGPAQADAIEDFYKGKALNMIIGLGEGGGYDLSARLVAQHLGDFIPGKPVVVPRNMPGAGSIAAAEYVYNIAPDRKSTRLNSSH